MQTITIAIILIFFGQILGSMIGLFFKPSKKLLHASLAFAATLMISVSVFTLIPESYKIISVFWIAVSFMGGFLVFFAFDKLLPHINPQLCQKETPAVRRCVFMLVIGIALHNIPEGFAGGSGFALSTSLGISILIALMIQDIPENLATIIPLYAMTKNKIKTFSIMLVTILFELFGFLAAYYIFGYSSKFIGVSLAAAAGIMIYLSVEELIPNSRFNDYRTANIIAILLGLASFLLTMLIAL